MLIQSPKKVMAEILKAWKHQDYKTIWHHTQRTWKADKLEAFENLMMMFGRYELVCWRKLKAEKGGKWMYDCTVDVRLHDQWYTINARLIKEIAPRKPSKHGRWGVNPDSIFLRMVKRAC